MFLKILQKSQKKTVRRFCFNKVAGLQARTLLKNRLQHRCFPSNFANVLTFKETYFAEHLRTTASAIWSSNNLKRYKDVQEWVYLDQNWMFVDRGEEGIHICLVTLCYFIVSWHSLLLYMLSKRNNHYFKF